MIFYLYDVASLQQMQSSGEQEAGVQASAFGEFE